MAMEIGYHTGSGDTLVFQPVVRVDDKSTVERNFSKQRDDQMTRIRYREALELLETPPAKLEKMYFKVFGKEDQTSYHGKWSKKPRHPTTGWEAPYFKEHGLRYTWPHCERYRYLPY